MGQCCTNQEKEHEALKTSSLGRVQIHQNSRDNNDELNLSEVENSIDEITHGPPENVAKKIKALPSELKSKLDRLTKTHPLFEFNHDPEVMKKAIFLGMRQFENQSIYIGHWFEKKRNGRGQQIYPDGSVYEGYWVDGKREGFGRFIDYSGDVYEGEWKDD